MSSAASIYLLGQRHRRAIFDAAGPIARRLEPARHPEVGVALLVPNPGLRALGMSDDEPKRQKHEEALAATHMHLRAGPILSHSISSQPHFSY